MMEEQVLMKDFLNVGTDNGENNAADRVFAGRYKIIKLIGEGGMGVVYLARDLEAGRDVAVKILKSELTYDEEFIRRFDTEARAASSLSYPNIVKVFDVGMEAGMRYMVMEYVDGISLKELITKNKSLDWQAALPIAIQIGLALENAHKNGIIHRDIKPHNILITRDFIAKVTDFGIARAASANTVTLSGNKAFGSVHYFSPEQARGGIVGEQSDIYSMGILLYEMLTGKLPFNGDTSVSIALKHIQEKPVPPKQIEPAVPEGLSNIVMKCIQKSISLRYKTARELVDELDAFMVDPDASYGYIDNMSEDAGTTRLTSLGREPNFGKLRELEEQKRRLKKVRIREAMIIVVALVVTGFALYKASAYSINWIKSQITSPTAEYTVETYVGSRLDDVKSKLDAANIAYEILYEQNDTVDQEIVFYQSVPKGLTMRPGGASVITLKVSSGKDTVRLGDYVGKNYKLVESDLAQVLGLKVIVIKELSSEMGKDNVIETIPGAGNDVPKGGEVTLIVSEGLINVVVPDVRGLLRSEGIIILEEAHLRKGSEALIGSDQFLPEERQYILGTEPAQGTEVKALTSIMILLGSYEDYQSIIIPVATPTLSPTPSPAPSPSPTLSLSPDPGVSSDD